MILAHKHIKEALDNGVWTAHRDGKPIGSDALTIGSNSINVSLGDKILIPRINRPKYCYIDLHEPESVIWKSPMESNMIKNNQFYFQRNDFVLMHGRERIDCSAPLMIDNKETYFVPMVETRSTLARCGVSCHLSAGFGDLGFSSSWTWEITTQLPIILRTGDEIGQVYFESSSDGSVKYEGAYTDQHDEPRAPVLGKDRFQRWK